MNSHYCSFLLRLWFEPNNPPVWRAMLENPVSGDRHGFASLDALFTFIHQETEQLEEKNQAFSRFPYQGDIP